MAHKEQRSNREKKKPKQSKDKKKAAQPAASPFAAQIPGQMARPGQPQGMKK